MREELNPAIRDIPMPPGVVALQVRRGYPVPWFVAWVDGEPEFRAAEATKQRTAMTQHRCWVCGGKLHDALPAFVIGPMCAGNRTTSEPPSHLACAEYSVRACPFLTKPQMVRREGGMPEGTKEAAGCAIPRNPAVSLIWQTRQYREFRVRADAKAMGGTLIRLGDPEAVSWWREGRPATRAEVTASIDSGIPILMASTGANPNSEEVQAFRRSLQAVEHLFPKS